MGRGGNAVSAVGGGDVVSVVGGGLAEEEVGLIVLGSRGGMGGDFAEAEAVSYTHLTLPTKA